MGKGAVTSSGTFAKVEAAKNLWPRLVWVVLSMCWWMELATGCQDVFFKNIPHLRTEDLLLAAACLNSLSYFKADSGEELAHYSLVLSLLLCGPGAT